MLLNHLVVPLSLCTVSVLLNHLVVPCLSAPVSVLLNHLVVPCLSAPGSVLLNHLVVPLSLCTVSVLLNHLVVPCLSAPVSVLLNHLVVPCLSAPGSVLLNHLVVPQSLCTCLCASEPLLAFHSLQSIYLFIHWICFSAKHLFCFLSPSCRNLHAHLSLVLCLHRYSSHISYWFSPLWGVSLPGSLGSLNSIPYRGSYCQVHLVLLIVSLTGGLIARFTW